MLWSVHEHFLTFIQAEKVDAASLSSYIKQLISTYDQGYDGGSVMSGHCTGVQTRVREFAPYATYDLASENRPYDIFNPNGVISIML